MKNPRRFRAAGCIIEIFLNLKPRKWILQLIDIQNESLHGAHNYSDKIDFSSFP